MILLEVGLWKYLFPLIFGKTQFQDLYTGENRDIWLNLSSIMKVEHIEDFIFVAAFNLLFGCRFPLTKGTEKTGTCTKTCGLSCPMRPFVTG